MTNTGQEAVKLSRLRVPVEQAQALMQEIQEINEPSDGTVSIITFLKNNMGNFVEAEISPKVLYDKFIEKEIMLGNYQSFYFHYRRIKKAYLEAQSTKRSEE